MSSVYSKFETNKYENGKSDCGSKKSTNVIKDTKRHGKIELNKNKIIFIDRDKECNEQRYNPGDFSTEDYKSFPNKFADYLLKNDADYTKSGVEKNTLVKTIGNIFDMRLNQLRRKYLINNVWDILSNRYLIKGSISDELIKSAIESVSKFFIDTTPSIVCNPKGIEKYSNDLSLLDYDDVINILNGKNINIFLGKEVLQKACKDIQNSRKEMKEAINSYIWSDYIFAQRDSYLEELGLSDYGDLTEDEYINRDKILRAFDELADQEYIPELKIIEDFRENILKPALSSAYAKWRDLPKDVRWNLEKSEAYIKEELDKIDFKEFVKAILNNNDRKLIDLDLSLL